jgi:chromosome segregation ATPase
MIEQETIVNSLEDKFRKLVSLLDQLKAEKDLLLKEKDDLQSAVNLKDNEIKDLQGKYEHLKLARLLVTGSEDVHSAKLKVNKIVREIDKCIALLNK